MATVHPSLTRRHAFPLEPARRREGRAACRAGPQELGRAALARCPRAESLSPMTRIRLPRHDGTLHDYTLRAPSAWTRPAPGTRFNRVAYSAAHVVADPFSSADPWLQPAIDWDATLEYRRYLWSLGLGVAEAMDTAQRGMGLDWPASLELIDRSLKLAREMPGALIACGAGTDHLEARPSTTVHDVIEAYALQCERSEEHTSELQSRLHLVCRLLLEKKKHTR